MRTKVGALILSSVTRAVNFLKFAVPSETRSGTHTKSPARFSWMKGNKSWSGLRTESIEGEVEKNLEEKELVLQIKA